MKKLLILMLLSIALVPGCGKKKIQEVKPKPTVVQVEDPKEREKNKTSIDEADEFVLEEDEKENIADKTGVNVFEEQKEQKPSSEEMKQDASWAELDVDENSQKTDVIQFDFDKSNVKPSEDEKITKNVKMIKEKLAENKDAKVVVEGHSCKIAKNEDHNYALSQERAAKVKRIYVKRGVPSEKIKAVGMGTSKLLTNAEGREAQSINRRVETVFLK